MTTLREINDRSVELGLNRTLPSALLDSIDGEALHECVAVMPHEHAGGEPVSLHVRTFWVIWLQDGSKAQIDNGPPALDMSPTDWESLPEWSEGQKERALDLQAEIQEWIEGDEPIDPERLKRIIKRHRA